MAKTSLIISSTTATDGKKLQKTLTDINSNATNDQLKSFAQVLNSFTTNTYLETNRVDRINCDTEDSGGSAAVRNLTVSGAAAGATATITYNTDGVETAPSPVPVFMVNNDGTISAQYIQPTQVASDDNTVVKYTVTCPNQVGDLFVGVLNRNDFAADFVRIPVN